MNNSILTIAKSIARSVNKALDDQQRAVAQTMQSQYNQQLAKKDSSFYQTANQGYSAPKVVVTPAPARSTATGIASRSGGFSSGGTATKTGGSFSQRRTANKPPAVATVTPTVNTVRTSDFNTNLRQMDPYFDITSNGGLYPKSEKPDMFSLYSKAMAENLWAGVKNTGYDFLNTFDSINVGSSQMDRVRQSIEKSRSINPNFPDDIDSLMYDITGANKRSLRYEEPTIEKINARTQKSADYNQSLYNKYGNLPGYNTLSQTSQAIGGMLPVIAAGKVMPFGNDIALAARAYGNALGDALYSNATPAQAKTYAAIDAAFEYAVERGVNGVPGLLTAGSTSDQIIKELAFSHANTTAGRYIIMRLCDATGEGVEEVVSEFFTPLIKELVYEEQPIKPTLESLIKSFTGGALVSGIMGTVNIKSDVEYLDKTKIKTDNNGKYPFDMLADSQKVNDTVEDSIEDQIKFISKDTLKPYPTSALPDNILNYVEQFNKYKIIPGKAGSFSMDDIKLLSRQLHTEFAVFTINGKSFMVKGSERGVNLSTDFEKYLLDNKGTLDYHSHPFTNDALPSQGDINTLKKLYWQDESKLIDQNGSINIFNQNGPTGRKYISDKSSSDTKEQQRVYENLFGGTFYDE